MPKGVQPPELARAVVEGRTGLSNEDRLRRMRELERAISEEGWSATVRDALALKWGVHATSVNNLRRQWVRLMRDTQGDSLAALGDEERRAGFLAELRLLAGRAAQRGRFGPAVSALRLIAEIEGWINHSPTQLHLHHHAQHGDGGQSLAARFPAEDQVIDAQCTEIEKGNDDE